MRNGFQTGPHSYVEVTHNSYGSRVAGSLCGACFGWVMLAVLAPMVLFFNEQNAVEVAKELDYLSSNLKEIGHDPPLKIAAGFASNPIHFTGVITGEMITDTVGPFTVQVEAVKMSRSTEMFQWVETVRSQTQKQGGSSTTVKNYDYHTSWSSSYKNSNSFKIPHGHQNPSPALSLSMQRTTANNIAIGELRASSEVVSALPTSRLFLNADNVKNIGANVHVQGNHVFLGAQPHSPQVGDLRVSVDYFPSNEQISVVGIMQSDGTVTGAPNSVLPLVGKGSHSAASLIAARHSQNTLLLWVLRVVGFFVLYIGMSICVEPVNVVGDIVPFFGTVLRWVTGTAVFLLSVALTLIIIAVAWLFARPVLSATLLLMGLSFMYFSHTQAKKNVRHSD